MSEAFANNHKDIADQAPDNTFTNFDMLKAHSSAIIDLEEGEFNVNATIVDEILNNELLLDAPSQQNVKQVHLTLHNSFELLDNGS